LGRGAWEAVIALLWTLQAWMPKKGTEMAEEEEPILTHPGTHEMAVHVHDYERFTKLFKYSAIGCLIIGLVSLIIIKAYW
jgi:hypothetical protein